MAAPVTKFSPAVPDGPWAHRRRVRRLGPVAALVAPAVCGLLAVVALWNSESPARGVVGMVLAVAAAPLMPMFGVPAVTGTRLVAAVAASGLMWLLIGRQAARAATRVPGASWPEWRREYRRLALGASFGGLGALALGAVVLLVLAR